MFIKCELVILILALTNGQVHTGEIIGGQEAVPHSRPYMVVLEKHMQNGKTSHCGGFLLSEDFVMTAAHCQARSYTVLLGVHDVRKSNEIQRVSVEQSFPHKDYNPTDYKSDIMILKLSSKISFSKNVSPIALAGQDDGSLPKSCIVFGWGTTHKNIKHMSPILMEASVTLIDNERCPKAKSYCSEGETGPAEGDSGGPLVCEDGKAYGVVSSFKTDSGGQRINSYTKISDYKRWIDSTMKKALKKSYSALLGVQNVRNCNEIHNVPVEQTFPHKDCNATDYKNDIMLLKLSSKVNFSKNVRPIALPDQDDGSLPKSCIVSGWGIADKNTKYISHILMEVSVTLIDNKGCPTENTYCSEGETGPGKGDSGGPLVFEDRKAYGVVSSSFKTDSDGLRINSYTKISDYRSWIDSIVEPQSSTTCNN